MQRIIEISVQNTVVREFDLDAATRYGLLSVEIDLVEKLEREGFAVTMQERRSA